jgi:hypothetical protein
MGNSGKMRHRFSSIIIMALLLAVIPAVSAYTVSQVTDPAILLHPGDTITISVSNLKVGDNFKYHLTSGDLDTVGNTVMSNSVILPFGFKLYPVTHLETTGYSLAANPLTVDYDHGNVHFNPTYPPNTNPIEITNANINPGDYVLSLKGTKTPGVATAIDYSVGGTLGTIPAPDPQLLTFTITNMNSGQITIDVFDGAVSKFSATYTIGTAPPAPTPRPGSDSDGPAAPEGPNPQLAPPNLLAPPGIQSSSISLLHDNDGDVLTGYTLETDPSAGFNVTLKIKQGTRIVTGASKPVNEIILTPPRSCRGS